MYCHFVAFGPRSVCRVMHAVVLILSDLVYEYLLINNTGYSTQ